MQQRLILLILLWTCSIAQAGQFATTIDMNAKGGSTFYVDGRIGGVGAVEFMVDTGSGYLTINERMLEALEQSGQARFVRTLRGRLANGTELSVPLYSIAAVSIGDDCWLQDVEAAVFPGEVRPILGLNVLKRAAPFIFSFDPPTLALSHCAAAIAVAPVVPEDFSALED